MEDDINFFLRSHGGYGNGGGNKCGRWNPTTEQMRVLNDLFRSGLRTPNTEQIQKISSQLSMYGKIESKNVFYWFQNHKARDRQKRRRVSMVIDNQQNENRRQDKNESSSPLTSHFLDINEVQQDGEKAKETLQLFPLNTFNKLESEKLRLFTDDQRKGIASFTYDNAVIGSDHEMHQTLNLSLSFF